MNSPEFKIIFAIIIFAISFGLPLLQVILKKYKAYQKSQEKSVPTNHEDNDIFWEDEIVESDDEDAGYYEPDQEMYEPEPEPAYSPEDYMNVEAAQPAAPVPVQAEPEYEPSEESYGYAGFLRGNLRSSIVASEILGKPKALQD